MRMRVSDALRRGLTGATVIALATAGVVALAAPVGAQGTATPWAGQDPNQTGGLSFYDATGKVITSGSTSAKPFAAFVEGRVGLRAGDNTATLFGYRPVPGGTPDTWSDQEQFGLSTPYPNSAAPAPVKTSAQPVNTGGNRDLSLDNLAADFPTSSNDVNYENVYEIRMYTSSDTESIGAKYDYADIKVNPTAHTWSLVYSPGADNQAPDAPTSVTATAGDGAATVSWTAPANNGGSAITGYDVQYSSNGGSTYAAASPDFHTSTSTTQTVTGLTNGTSYVFKVAAINAVGTGGYSAPSGAVTPHTITVPGAPTGVSATAGNARATVSWTTPTNDGGSPITGYNVQYSADGGTTFTDASSGFHTSTNTSQVVTGLANNTSYVFHVAAINSAGTGPYSTVSNSVTPRADNSSISITAPRSAAYGSIATFGTRLLDSTTARAIGSAPVSLYRRADARHAFLRLATVNTSTSGTAAFRTHLTANAQYQWRYAGTTTHKAVNSAIASVPVSQVIKAYRSASSVRHGSTFRVYGTVSPTSKGQRVYLQQLVGRTYRTLSVSAVIKLQTLPNRHRATGYVLAIKLSRAGSFRFRVYKKPTTTLSSGYSGSVAVRVV